MELAAHLDDLYDMPSVYGKSAHDSVFMYKPIHLGGEDCLQPECFTMPEVKLNSHFLLM